MNSLLREFRSSLFIGYCLRKLTCASRWLEQWLLNLSLQLMWQEQAIVETFDCLSRPFSLWLSQSICTSVNHPGQFVHPSVIIPVDLLHLYFKQIDGVHLWIIPVDLYIPLWSFQLICCQLYFMWKIMYICESSQMICTSLCDHPNWFVVACTSCKLIITATRHDHPLGSVDKSLILTVIWLQFDLSIAHKNHWNYVQLMSLLGSIFDFASRGPHRQHGRGTTICSHQQNHTSSLGTSTSSTPL